MKIQSALLSQVDKALPIIRIGKIKEVPYCEIDLDMEDETWELLAKAGREAILKDKDALARYALVEAFKELDRSEREKDARQIG